MEGEGVGNINYLTIQNKYDLDFSSTMITQWKCPGTFVYTDTLED